MHRVVKTRSRRLVRLAMALGVLWTGQAAAQQGEPQLVDPASGQNLLNASLGDAGVYDGATQYMMIDVMDVVLAGRDGSIDGSLGLAPPTDTESWYLATRADGSAIIFSGPDFSGPSAAELPDHGRPVDDVAQEANVVAFLRSLGESTGAAFQLQIESDAPVRFNGQGIVVEPLVIRDQSRPAFEAEMTKFAAGNPVTQVLNAYCLEFMKGPPSPNQLFRIGSEQLQDLYAPAANILTAGRQLVEGGLLEDHPLDYIHSIKQWSLWAAEGNFSFEAFSDRFLAHAEDNFTVAGMDWTEQVESLVEETLPDRWEQIQTILQAASQLPGGTEWRN